MRTVQQECPGCGSDLRREVTVVLDVPFSPRKIDKNLITGNSVEIKEIIWTETLIYCPSCNYKNSTAGSNR